MKKYVLMLSIILGMLATANAQYGGVIVRPGYGYGPRPYHRYPVQQNYPSFTPYLSISVGYGFPNLDKYQLATPYNEYQGNISQMGPLTASFDYHFSRFTSIGLLITHGTVSANNYISGSNAASSSDKLDNWSYMINLMSYFPVGSNSAAEPYLRTAIGLNSWSETTNNLQVTSNSLPDLAYQIGLGANFKIAPKTAFFAEVGYGKYILQAGLHFKF